MALERSIGLSLLVPTLLCGLPVAVCAFWVLGSASSAVFVLAACLASSIGNAVSISRCARNANAQLRRAELRGTASPR